MYVQHVQSAVNPTTLSLVQSELARREQEVIGLRARLAELATQVAAAVDQARRFSDELASLTAREGALTQRVTELTEQLSEMPRQLQHMTKVSGLSKYAATALGALSLYALFVSGVDFYRDLYENPSAEVLEAEIQSLGVQLNNEAQSLRKQLDKEVQSLRTQVDNSNYGQRLEQIESWISALCGRGREKSGPPLRPESVHETLCCKPPYHTQPCCEF
jgi:phage-related tail protein